VVLVDEDGGDDAGRDEEEDANYHFDKLSS
jgi:hypothetical protein